MGVKLPARVFLLTAVATAAMVLALVLVGRPARWPEPESPPQQGEAASPGRENETAAHRPDALARLIREPQNTWSNLAFVAGGAVLVCGAASRVARAIGIALIGVGIGSFLYHASASRTLRQLDVAAMYWLFVVTGAHSLAELWGRLRPTVERHAFAVLTVALGLAVALTLGRNFRVAGVKPFSLTVATVVTAALLISALVRRQERWRRAAGIVGLFAAAVVCQLGDRPGGWLFAPTATLQAHAAWHVLSAIALVLAVRSLDAPHARAATLSDLRSSLTRADALR